MEILGQILLFLSQTLIIVLGAGSLLVLLAVLIAKAKTQKSFEIEILNEKFKDNSQALKLALLNEDELKAEKKKIKKEEKNKPENSNSKARLFVLDFLKADIKASSVESLREEITTVLGVANSQDEVVVRIESPGGLVHSYGLAAAQLLRIKDAKIPLTVCVDQVAASGGYLMACTADKIISSPFALIGSIGVVAQVPNFNKLLKKYDIDYKEYTAGDYKRTVSIFGEITDKGESKFKEQLEVTHELFKNFVGLYRPKLDMKLVATGEFWYGQNALNLGLIDVIKTSDDYLLEKSKSHQVVRVSFEKKPSFAEKVSEALGQVATMILEKVFTRAGLEKRV